MSTKVAAIDDCIVTYEDFMSAVDDVVRSMGDSDFSTNDEVGSEANDI